MSNKRTVYNWILILVAFAGIIDAGYLTMQHLAGKTITCSVLNGCHAVTSSQYAMVGPVPLAMIGLGFYITVFVLAIAYMRSGHTAIIQTLWLLSAVAIIVSTILVCLQIFVIQALCLYCIISAAESTILFIFATLLKHQRLA